MKRKQFFFLFLFVCQAILISAQTNNFIPGEVYLNGHIIVKGLINFRDWDSNPRHIQFKPTDSDQRIIYTTADLEGFTIYNYDTYRKLTSRIDMNPVEVNAVTTFDTSLLKLDTVFIRELATAGSLKLYELVDFKKHYFLQIGSDVPKELGFRRTFNALTSTLSTDNWFRSQLKFALGDSISKKQKRVLESLSYDARSLTKFFKSLNGYEVEKSAYTESKTLKQPAQFFVGGGIVYQKFGLSSFNDNLTSLKFEPSLSYTFSGGVDLYNTRHFNNLFLRIELSLSQLSANGEGENKMAGSGFTQTNYYSIKQINLTPAASILYSFIRLKNSKVYGGGGANFNFSTYKDDTYRNFNHFNNGLSEEKNYFDPKKLWISVDARIGIVIKRKIEAGISYQLAGSFLDYTYTSETSTPLAARVYYRF